MTTKLAILDDYQGIALELADWSVLPNNIEITVFRDTLADIESVAERLETFEILAAMRERTPFPRPLFEKLPNLKLLVTTGMRNGAIDMQAAADHGVTVCGTSGNTESTVEMIWALIQAVVRGLPQQDKATREGKWQTEVGWTLAGRTIGLVGLGRLGARTSAVANFFNMRVIAWSQNLTAERALECGAELVSKQELFKRSDVVSIHLLLSRRTRSLITADDLIFMKPDAYLVNTSRGPIIEETALIDVLRAGRIGGAALDVFDREPLPNDHPFLGLDNVIISPHMAYVTEENLKEFYSETVEDIVSWLNGDPIRILK